MAAIRLTFGIFVVISIGCVSWVSKTVTPKPVGTSIEVSHRVEGGERSAKLSPDSDLGRQLATWLSKKRVAYDDYKSYVPDLVVTGETYQLNLHEDRVIFSWRMAPFSETSTQQTWKADVEDRKLRRTLIEWLRDEPSTEFRRSGPPNDNAQSQK